MSLAVGLHAFIVDSTAGAAVTCPPAQMYAQGFRSVVVHALAHENDTPNYGRLVEYRDRARAAGLKVYVWQTLHPGAPEDASAAKLISQFVPNRHWDGAVPNLEAILKTAGQGDRYCQLIDEGLPVGLSMGVSTEPTFPLTAGMRRLEARGAILMQQAYKLENDRTPTDARLFAVDRPPLYAGTDEQPNAGWCVTPETRVLTRDLRWCPAGELDVGDRLIGYDEFRPSAGPHPARKIAESVVTAAGGASRPGYVIYLEDGTMLRCSSEHPWLVSERGGYLSWRSAEALAEDLQRGNPRYLPRFLNPWRERTGWDDGYLAGLFDGEGSLSMRPRAGRADSFSLTVSQREGGVLDVILRLLDRAGVRYGLNRAGSAVQVQINGTWLEKAAVLGTFRPRRLLAKFEAAPIEREARPLNRLRIVEMRPVAKLEIVPLSTSSRTYFAEGFCAHNSYWAHFHGLQPPRTSRVYCERQEAPGVFRIKDGRNRWNVSDGSRLIYSRTTGRVVGTLRGIWLLPNVAPTVRTTPMGDGRWLTAAELLGQLRAPGARFVGGSLPNRGGAYLWETTQDPHAWVL